VKVLVTGGTGSLGRPLVRALLREGCTVRILSRKPRPDGTLPQIEWIQTDIASGEDLREAVRGVDQIIHAASDPRRTQEVDVHGTQRLVDAAKEENAAHLVFVSIVGINEIDYGYYQQKVAAERIIESSGLKYTIVRATQFHSLVNSMIGAAARLPLIMLLPTDFKFQTVAESDVVERLVGCVRDPSLEPVINFGGPEVMTLGEMARKWMEINGARKRLIRLPIPGSVATAFRAGKNTTVVGGRGSISWDQWLRERRERKLRAANSG
jgi:uncharacterized protein YbjT (DUF2867 family)